MASAYRAPKRRKPPTEAHKASRASKGKRVKKVTNTGKEQLMFERQSYTAHRGKHAKGAGAARKRLGGK